MTRSYSMGTEDKDSKGQTTMKVAGGIGDGDSEGPTDWVISWVSSSAGNTHIEGARA